MSGIFFKFCDADVSPSCEPGWFVWDHEGDAYGPFETALDAQTFAKSL